MDDYVDDGDGTNGSIDATPRTERSGQVPNGYSYTVKNYEDARGRVSLRQLRVAGPGHAWSGGPVVEALEFRRITRAEAAGG